MERENIYSEQSTVQMGMTFILRKSGLAMMFIGCLQVVEVLTGLSLGEARLEHKEIWRIIIYIKMG